MTASLIQDASRNHRNLMILFRRLRGNPWLPLSGMPGSASDAVGNKYLVRFKNHRIHAAMQDGYAVQSFSLHGNLEGFTGQKSDETILPT